MTQTVMVSLDCSSKDEVALPVGAAIADQSDINLHLVHVLDAISRRVAVHAELLGVDEGTPSGRPAAEARIAELARRLAAERGRRVTWEVVESAHVAPALIRHAAERDAAVVVMATRAARFTERALFGSVAHRVVRECPVPVVVVPPGTAHLRGMQPQFRRILAPLDGSDLGARGLDLLIGLPRATSLELVLLAVISRESDRMEAEARLASSAERVRVRGIENVEVTVLVAADPVAAIISALRELLIDAIAMSTNARRGVDLFVNGSVTEGVVRASEVPILLFSPVSVEHATNL